MGEGRNTRGLALQVDVEGYKVTKVDYAKQYEFDTVNQLAEKIRRIRDRVADGELGDITIHVSFVGVVDNDFSVEE